MLIWHSLRIVFIAAYIDTLSVRHLNKIKSIKSMANLDKDKVIADFTKAYTDANGKAPSIEAKSGWYSVDGGKNVRLAQIQEMTEALSGDVAENVEAPAAKAPAKKTAKPAAKQEAKPKKTAKKKAKNSGFSVKDFWAEKLKAEAPGAILPR